LCPDSVAEFRSREDRLSVLQDKMSEYVETGAQLGWLIDPAAKCVYVYRPGQQAELLQDPATIGGDPVLPRVLCSVWRIPGSAAQLTDQGLADQWC